MVIPFNKFYLPTYQQLKAKVVFKNCDKHLDHTTVSAEVSVVRLDLQRKICGFQAVQDQKRMCYHYPELTTFDQLILNKLILDSGVERLLLPSTCPLFNPELLDSEDFGTGPKPEGSDLEPYFKRSCLTHSPKIFAACLAHRPSAVLWLTTLGACFVVHGVCLLIFHYFLLLSTETQLPGTGPLESPAAPDVDSDSGASTNIDFIPGTQEEEQPGVLGPPARRRRIQIQDEVLSDEEEEPPLPPGSPPPRGALPAEERLTRERGRLRRVSVLTSVGERLLEHCYEESRRAAAADQAMLTLIAQEGRKLRAVLRETNQILREGVEEVRLIRRLMERAVAVMERAYPPQIAPPPPPTPTPPLPAPTPPTPSQNASTQTRRRTILGKRKIKPAEKYSPS
ncbi:uncharacterized protein LOC143841712 [Paroedura picta]|uniref:uncharacterized protein LOC143841712 n=1 Tax=Paroedura picta TaxID=143630 RepID=UPI0040577A24